MDTNKCVSSNKLMDDVNQVKEGNIQIDYMILI